MTDPLEGFWKDCGHLALVPSPDIDASSWHYDEYRDCPGRILDIEALGRLVEAADDAYEFFGGYFDQEKDTDPDKSANKVLLPLGLALRAALPERSE